MASSGTAASRKRRRDQQDGGYEYEFVDTILDKYTCSICTKVLCDAHLTVCCGQHFCASCLTHWLGTQQWRKTCPHCQKEDFQHIPNKAMIREVNEFKIRCTNRREGCGWVGELGGLKSHLDSDKGCGYEQVTCTNKECREEVRRKDLCNHEQEKCNYRHFVCEFCGQRNMYKAITGHHYSECPGYPLACPNRCGVTGIRRRTMPDHHSSCPLEPLDCPFKDAGCTEKIARKHMEDHMTANQQRHILQSLQSLQQSTKEMKQTLQDTKQELWDLRASTVGLNAIGATLTFRVTDFPQLIEEKKSWRSLPFSIGDKVRVRLVVYPSGVGRGEGSHVSVCLKLVKVLMKDTSFGLACNVSISVMQGQTPYVTKVIELCTFKKNTAVSDEDDFEDYTTCISNIRLPSPGSVLESEDKLVEVRCITSLLVKDSLVLQLKRLRHHHC